MAFEKLVSGTVFIYPYLWIRQAAQGETEGRKDRLVVVGVRARMPDGLERLILFPITSKDPGPHRFAFEIPAREKKRAGLDANMRLWIILDEGNSDAVIGSYYLINRRPLGSFSKSYFLPIAREFISRRKMTKLQDRTK